ncbi:MAG: peptidylprolyl isomerase [Anaerolineae bacterium]
MQRSFAILLLLVLCAACAPAAPATIPVSGNTVSQNPTTAPTEASVESNAVVPAANNEAVSGEAQTPTQICQNATPAQTPSNRTFAAYPDMILQPDIDYRAVMCTGAGPVYVDLFEDLTPITVNSFVFLAQQGYYNNTTFHRVIQDFMAQGGDPTATGTGGPGYTFQEEFVGFLHYDRPGWLAMARTNQPGSNGSQFFITTAAYSSLDYQYTLFGEVLEGLDNVRNIRLRDPQTDPNPGTSLDTVVIITDPASVVTTYTAPAPATQVACVWLAILSSDDTIVQAALQLSVSSALSASEVQ